MHRFLSSAISGACLFALGSPVPIGVTQRSSFPTYARTLQLEPSADTSANVSIGDVNGDGKLDLVLIKGRHWPGMSRVLLGDGRGSFPTAYDLTDARYRSYSGTLVDLDGDGTLDVILSNDTPDPKVILLNDGTGHFRRASTFGQAQWETRNVAIADLDGDGRPDIVVANRSDHAVQYFCLNQGGGRFDAACTAFADYSATTITPADVDGDGRIDLVVPHRDGGQGYVYLNGGKATFSAARRIPFGPPNAAVRMAAVSDLDGDGALDIVVIDEKRHAVEIHYGDKAGGFGLAQRLDPGGATPYALAVADLDRDGHPDILVGYVEAPSAAFFGDGKLRQFARVGFGDSRGTTYGFAVADIDGDGYLDVAAARSEAPNMVYFGDAGGRATSWQPSPGHAQVPLWPGIPPNARPAPDSESIATAPHPVAGKSWTYVRNVSRPTLTVYSPTGNNTGAAVVVFPGGGYQILAIDLEGTEVCDWLTAKGITCVLLKYRVPRSGPSWQPDCRCQVNPKPQPALQDAQPAIGLVRQHAVLWHIDQRPHSSEGL
jgi:hypothetical protein